MSNKFQNEDFKSEADLIAKGGTKAQLLNTTKIYSPKSTSILETVLRKHKFDGVAAPEVTNDISENYEVGSIWHDLANNQAYICFDNSAGAAVWKQTSGGVATAPGQTAVVTILNNQTAFLDTGIVFSYPTIKSFEIFAEIIRTTTTSEQSEIVKIMGIYRSGTSKWEITDYSAGLSGVEFDMTADGRLQYKSSNMSGASYLGVMSYSYQANGGSISGTNPNEISAAGLNFIKGNAESGLTGWSTYADAAAAKPVDGLGGSANITWSLDSVAPLAGLKSFLFTKDATNRQGQGVGYQFTIDSAYKAKVLTIDFDYQLVSGTFVAGNPTTNSDIMVFVYDVTNNILIEPSSLKLFSNSSTVADKFSATFQTAHNSTSYRLIFHCATTSAAAYSMRIDNIAVSPSKYTYGTPITDWTPYTPGCSWTTNTTTSGMWRRVGDTIECRNRADLTGAPNASSLAFLLPPGLTIDSSKQPYTTQDGLSILLSSGIIRDFSNNSFPVHALINGANQILIGYYSDNTNAIRNLGVNNTAPITIGNGDAVEIKYSAPITGWSSSVQMSDSADTRVVAGEFFNATSALSNNGSTFNDLVFGSISSDSHGAYNTSTGIYTVPTPGWYAISSAITMTGSYANNGSVEMAVTVNGTIVRRKITRLSASTGSGTFDVSSSAIFLRAGDQVKIQANAGNWSTLNYLATTLAYNFFTISKVNGPSAIAASEFIGARYTLSSGQTIANSGLNITLNYNLKDFDSHGAYTQPNFVVPASGKYDIKAYAEFSSTNGGGTIRLNIMRNGSAVSTEWRTAAGTAAPWACAINDTLQLNAGDQISITINWNGTNGASLNGNTRFAIKRVGL